ncbi:unnamed protein product [Caenorhabditis brenneri]
MTSKRLENWDCDEDYIALMEFLIEKTKNVKSPLEIRELADEYKRKNGLFQRNRYFSSKISCLAGKVGKMETIDTGTKVKIMFALRSTVCAKLLKKFRENACVEVGKHSRIKKYEAYDGSLKLGGKKSKSVKKMPRKRLNHRKNRKMIKFLIERTKNVKSPLKIRELADEYKQKTRSSRDYSYFCRRIVELAGKIGKEETIDKVTKMKIIFALRINASRKLLKKLREDAYVEVDEYKHITKYRAHDGSLNLERENSQSVKSMAEEENTRLNGPTYINFTKRAAIEVSDKPSKRRREIIDYRDPGSVGILNYSQSQLLQEPPREPSNPRIQELREPKKEIESQGTPRAPEPSGHQIKAEPGVNDNYTSKIKFLEAIRSLILSMHMPSLAPILEKTEKMIQECSNELIPNDEITLTMELLITKMINNSLTDLAENVESVSLRKFFRYLKTAIFTSELGGLENLFGKLYELIKQSALKEKKCPVGKVARALQDTLNNVGLSEVLQADEYYRAWILNEVIRETPIQEAYDNTRKLKPNVEYAEFEYWYYRFSNEHHNLING